MILVTSPGYCETSANFWLWLGMESVPTEQHSKISKAPPFKNALFNNNNETNEQIANVHSNKDKIKPNFG